MNLFMLSVMLVLLLMNFSFVNTQNCTLKSGLKGQCIQNAECLKEREFDEDTPCSSDPLNVCCESQPEDFIDNPFGRIAKRECKKFMDTVLEWKITVIIFGGKNASFEEFEFMAALGYGTPENTKWSCGGTLISSKHILTAAHCLESLEDGLVKFVRLGDLDLAIESDQAEPQNFNVLKRIAHPEYRYPSVYHDIAILELDRPVKFTDYVKPACLDYGQVKIDNLTQFQIIGWGYIETNNNRSTHLQYADLRHSQFDACKDSFPPNKRRLQSGLLSSQLCAEGINGKKDTCLGDSGGPLALKNAHPRQKTYKGYSIVGVTSFGKLCGFTDSPGVYTKVKSYVPWIETIVWPAEENNTLNGLNKVHDSEVDEIDSNDDPYGRVVRRECKKYLKDPVFEWKTLSDIDEENTNDPSESEFQFMAVLGYGTLENTKWNCAGALISTKHILTAAHCLESEKNGPVKYVLLGDLNLAFDYDLGEPQNFTVLKAIPHPDYKLPSANYDVAILELDRPVILSEKVQPACLDYGQVKLDNGTQLQAAGWFNFISDDGSATYLQKVDLGHLDFAKCTETNNLITKNQSVSYFCAQELNQTNTCVGDSGGIVARRNPHSTDGTYKGYSIIGISTFGQTCLSSAPSVYTKVKPYIPWIESIVWPN